MLPLSMLKGVGRGETAYVLGSAASMDYVDGSFFDGKTVFGCNYVYKKFPVTYTVSKDLHEHELIEAKKKTTVIISKHPAGDPRYEPRIVDGVFSFPHRPNLCTSIEWDLMTDDEITVSWSTITSALHVAAYMGYKDIFLMGVDGGRLDGKLNYSGYANHDADNEKWYESWVPQILDQTIFLRDKLKEKYKCNIMLVSPFINFRLEGHEFQ